MDAPKLIIATDGKKTAALLDGIVIGRGIERLDFSTSSRNGDKKPTIRILDLDVDAAKLSTDTDSFMDWLSGSKDSSMDTSNSENSIILHAHIDTSEIDEVAQKVAALSELLEKANSLTRELSTQEIKLSVEIDS